MSVVVKLFMDGGDLRGHRGPDQKVGDKVILEPLSSPVRTEAEIAAIGTEIDALRNGEKPFPE